MMLCFVKGNVVFQSEVHDTQVLVFTEPILGGREVLVLCPVVEVGFIYVQGLLCLSLVFVLLFHDEQRGVNTRLIF